MSGSFVTGLPAVSHCSPQAPANQFPYSRVSTIEQNPQLQIDALTKAGCERIFSDRLSGARADRPALAEAIEFVRRGDILCVWRLDRLARSVTHLIETISTLETRGVGFASLTETIDTRTGSGRLVMHVFAALAEFERALIRERTTAGLRAARDQGRTGGRPRLMTPDKLTAARKLLTSGMSAREVAAAVGISTPTLYRYVGGSAGAG
jgi:DNA invertase Pin-like site-specific DNA recombinase